MSEVVVRGYGMDFVAFCQKGFYEIHPEIIDVPGGIEYDCNFHLARYRPKALFWCLYGFKFYKTKEK